jgi:hypothetical protein
MKIYRGIVADSLSQANKWKDSTYRYSAQSWGPGIYWTQNPMVALEYGNYVYSAEIEPKQAKKIVEDQEIVILTHQTHKSLSKTLEASLELGMNSKYLFNEGRSWKSPKLKAKILMSNDFEESFNTWLDEQNLI